MTRFSLAVVFLTLLLSPASYGYEHWPRFRGPNADGVGEDDDRLPQTWNLTENVKWVSDVPGWGWSCPVVWGDRVFLTTVVGEDENIKPSKGLYLGEGVRDPAKGNHRWLVYCFDLNTGKELWKHEAHSGRPKVPRHPKSTYAAETAVTDGERLYVLFGDLGLYCYDLDGEPLWSREIEPKKTARDYGAAASPVVHDGQVIVVYDNLEASWIASYDTKTGEQRWKQPRDETHSWATPLVWKNEQRTEIVVPGRQRNRSYSLEGDLLWEFNGQMSSLVIPSPFPAHGFCYIASGYVGDSHRPTFAIRPGGSGDITPDGDFDESPFIEWYQGKCSPYNTTQLVYGDYLYTLYDQGFMTCHDAKTGEEVYGKKRFSPGGSFTSSPFAYNGHVFCLSEDGLTYVIKAGPEFELLARNELDELCIATPAIVGDKLLIRTASKLYCMTEGAELDPATAAKMQQRRAAAATVDIWTAAQEGKSDVVAKFLADGKSPDAKQPGSGRTPLTIASVYGQLEVAKLLIDKGADVSLASLDGNSPLHIAAFFTRTKMVELLLKAGASVEAKNGQGQTPIEIVSGDWGPQTEAIYEAIGNAVGLELEMEGIEQRRPEIVARLRKESSGEPKP